MTTATKQLFLNDVQGHKLTILRDDGLYRHIRMARPNSGYESFNIITWPGYLCYTGDMGTYVFTRIADMFEFFRPDSRTPLRILDGIDRRYWAEKVEGSDKHGGVTEFDFERFILEVKRRRLALIRERGRDLDKEQRRELWDGITDEVIEPIDQHQSESMAYHYVNDFQFIKSYSGYSPSPGDFFSLDTDDWPNCQSYTLRFTWCCFALRWAIAHYDIAKAFQKDPA